MTFRLLAITAALAVGCTPEQLEPPTTTTQSSEPQTGSTTTNAGSTTDQAPTGTTTDDPTGGSTGTPQDCEGPNGCFDCPPTKPAELLNACSDATCEPFSNTQERLPLLNDDGSLPPLP